MRHSRLGTTAAILFAASSALVVASPVAAAKPEEPPLTRGPHATPPTGAELDRLIALNDHPAFDEATGDMTALVVAYTVHVKIAADEEWRSFYGSDAFPVAVNAIEAADDAMLAEFAVDLVPWQTANWDSNPDSGNVDACDLLDDLKADRSPGNSDILVGFAKNYSNNYAGCAELGGDEAEVNWQSDSYQRWTTTQHEVSHLFSLPDRSPDTLNLHPNDVMENQFQKPDYWCKSFPGETADWTIFYQHRSKFE